MKFSWLNFDQYLLSQWNILFFWVYKFNENWFECIVFFFRPTVDPSVHPSVRYLPYLRNCKSCDYSFWYTCVKWSYLQEFFLFFQILIFPVVSAKRGLNWQKLCHTPFLRNHTSYDHHLWYTSVKWYLQAFFFSLKNFDFSGC